MKICWFRSQRAPIGFSGQPRAPAAAALGGIFQSGFWASAASLWLRLCSRCSSSRLAADLWRRFWWLIEDIGEGIVVQKCKGHATEADIQRGRASSFAKKGNDNADHFAGRGCEIAESLSPSGAERKAFREARRWYGWLAVLCSQWPADSLQAMRLSLHCRGCRLSNVWRRPARLFVSGWARVAMSLSLAVVGSSSHV